MSVRKLYLLILLLIITDVSASKLTNDIFKNIADAEKNGQLVRHGAEIWLFTRPYKESVHMCYAHTTIFPTEKTLDAPAYIESKDLYYFSFANSNCPTPPFNYFPVQGDTETIAEGFLHLKEIASCAKSVKCSMPKFEDISTDDVRKVMLLFSFDRIESASESPGNIVKISFKAGTMPPYYSSTYVEFDDHKGIKRRKIITNLQL